MDVVILLEQVKMLPNFKVPKQDHNDAVNLLGNCEKLWEHVDGIQY